jgi:hypothetical protein
MAKIYEVQKNVTLDGHNYGVDWFSSLRAPVMTARQFRGANPSTVR